MKSYPCWDWEGGGSIQCPAVGGCWTAGISLKVSRDSWGGSSSESYFEERTKGLGSGTDLGLGGGVTVVTR